MGFQEELCATCVYDIIYSSYITSSFSNDDFNSLKITLHRYIPFIKFFNFTSKEFLNNVYPYKMIIPEGKYFLNGDHKSYDKLTSQNH